MEDSNSKETKQEVKGEVKKEVNVDGSKSNFMRSLRLTKVTLNFGAGKNLQLLERGMLLLKKITGKDPVQTITQKRIPSWSLRPGLPIGAKITLRGEEAEKVLKQLLTAKENVLKKSNFDDEGNFSFGIHEYIEIQGIKYDPDIGMLGLEVAVTIERPGFRIKKRRMKRRKVPKKHRVSKEEAINFVKEKFGVEVR